MSEHIESPLPKGSIYPQTSQLEQLQAALEAAQNHMLILPLHNKRARAIQRGIIEQYQARIRELTRSVEWLS